MKTMYNSFMYAARAHAQWEIETSNNIIKNRKKLLILFVMALPLLIPAMAHAAATLPAFIGGKAAFGPSFFSTVNVLRFNSRWGYRWPYNRLYRGRRRIRYYSSVNELGGQRDTGGWY